MLDQKNSPYKGKEKEIIPARIDQANSNSHKILPATLWMHEATDSI
ncbi:hypothetical protein EJP617_34350 [Erwinia sp. Ejp617]|nr:hypothetical protein EJP617_34350 [Erwinia sp. Ejp617]